jgi:dTDP-glucose pyrophosphorylase
MMPPFSKHLIHTNATTREALKQLNQLAGDAILFLVDKNGQLQGSLTDGDVRRGLINGLNADDCAMKFAFQSPRYIEKGNYELKDIIALRRQEIKVLPVLNGNKEVVNVINLKKLRSYLPIDTVIMAGGRGSRLRPLTDSTPKPLLKVGDKPIIEHNIDRLCSFGIDDFWISVRYLGEQLEAYFGNGASKSINIQYVWEQEALGTIGAVSQIQNWQHDYILVTNSDILTTLDYEDFFLDFLEKGADMSVATIPYAVDVPYAVLETSNHHVLSFREKPTYTYYSNGGIYLMKRSVIDRIPKQQFYDSTDLMQSLIDDGLKLVSYPMRQYWLDIGKPEDFEKAQADIKHLEL